MNNPARQYISAEFGCKNSSMVPHPPLNKPIPTTCLQIPPIFCLFSAHFPSIFRSFCTGPVSQGRLGFLQPSLIQPGRGNFSLGKLSLAISSRAQNNRILVSSSAHLLPVSLTFEPGVADPCSCLGRVAGPLGAPRHGMGLCAGLLVSLQRGGQKCSKQ